jgi:DNA-binding NarL/FixJ family response regulator
LRGVLLLKIMLVDDHALIRDMLAEYLGRESSFSVVAVASSAREAVDLARECHPQVVIMDVEMPGMVCFDAAETMLNDDPEIRIVFLSAHAQDHDIEQALRIGAFGYLTKGISPETLVSAVHQVADNRPYFSPDVRDRIIFESTRRLNADAGKSRITTLSPREVQVLRYVGRGLAKKEIAVIMHVNMKTVEKHTGNLMRKVDIHDRVGLARFAICKGISEP